MNCFRHLFLWAFTSLIALPAFAQPDLTRVTAELEKLSSGGTTVAFVLLDPSGSVLLERQGNTPIKPASNNKLFTTAAALELLSPEAKTSTVLQITANPDSKGTVKGHLVVRGYGDPTISGRFEEDATDSTAPLRRMAAQIKASGVLRIQGDIVVDDSFFGPPSFHPRWPGGERGEWYSAEVSALAFNDNCVDLRWSGAGLLPATTASVTMIPQNSYVTLVNQVLVSAKGRPAGRDYRRGWTDNEVLAVGQIPVESTTLDSAAIHDGALWFGSVFRDVLRKEGIEVTGQIRRPENGENLQVVREISIPSPALPVIMNVINRNSQNFYAESLVRLLGALPATKNLDPTTTAPSGSWERGTAVAMEAVAQILNDGSRPVMVDGSGLSHDNRTTARQLARLCWKMTLSRHRTTWVDSLPIGATRGSLRSRYRQTSDTAQLGSMIYAKTGLISGVRSLSGHIESPVGPYAFSLILNDIPSREAGGIVGRMDQVMLAATAAIKASPGAPGRHPLHDVEPAKNAPLSVGQRTTPVPIPSPVPDFAAGKIMNESARLWFARLQQFEKEINSPDFTTGGIVLVGDSLTERFPTDDLLPNIPLANRGIGGDKVGGTAYLGIRDRLKVSVTRSEPRGIVLLIGTNDIVFARTDPANMRENYRILISEIQKEAPQARLMLVSIPPTRGRFTQYNLEITQFNTFIREFALAQGLDFVDLNGALRNTQGELPKSLTTDNLHLSEEGYRTYSRLLRPLLRATLEQSPIQRKPNPKPTN